MSQAIELHTLFTFRCFCLVQKKKGVAGAVIEAPHIPTDLVVAQEALAVESSSRLDFLLLHNLGTSFGAP